MRVLFICKKREVAEYLADGSSYSKDLSSGLYNSANFICTRLQERGFDAKLVQAEDNNCIDHLVSENRPTHVILEALWVVPEKFDVLTKLHPKVKWMVRLHSETPFLANEGMAMGWLFALTKRGVHITANSKRVCAELTPIIGQTVSYSPNYYPLTKSYNVVDWKAAIIDIGCFGAIRPLKNQLIQALAAINFADSLGLKLRFHINASRQECNGSPVYKNLKALFDNVRHELVEIPWLPHDDFIQYLKDHIDIGLQVSFTETFNIVAADLASCNIPVVTSSEIMWSHSLFQAAPTSMKDIVTKLKRVYRTRHLGLHNLNRLGLHLSNRACDAAWGKLYS